MVQNRLLHGAATNLRQKRVREVPIVVKVLVTPPVTDSAATARTAVASAATTGVV
jgi:hypothetical protein